MWERWPEPGEGPQALLDFQILPDQVSAARSSLLDVLNFSRSGLRKSGGTSRLFAGLIHESAETKSS